MAKKISKELVIEDNILVPFIKDVEKLDKTMKALEVTFGKTKDTVKDIKFDKELSKSIKKLSDAEKKLVKNEKDLIKTQKDQAKAQEKLKSKTDEVVKAKIKDQQATKKQKDRLKELIVFEDKQAGTLEKLAAVNSKLRRERQKLNLETEKGRLRLKQINTTLDKNNKKIKENSDALKKQKLNVGNYTASIKDAAASTGLFGGVITKLTTIQGILTSFTNKDNVSKEISTANTFRQIIAEKSLTRAKRAGLVAQKALNAALAASVIGAIILVLGGLIAAFTRTQRHVDQLSDAMSAMGAIVDIIIDRFSAIGSIIIDNFEKVLGKFTNLFNGFKIQILEFRKSIIEALSFEVPKSKLFDGFTIGVQDADKKVSELDKRIEELKKNLVDTNLTGAFDELLNVFDGITDEIREEVRLAARFNKLRRELTREQKIFSAQLAVETTALKEQRIFVVNKLNADKERLAVQKDISKRTIDLAEKQISLGEREIALAIDSKELTGDRLKLINSIRDGTISTTQAIAEAERLTLSSAAGEETLFNIIDKIVKLEGDRQKLADQRVKNEKAESRILRDIAAKDAKALLVISTERLNLAKDVTLSDEERLDNLVRFEKAFIESFKVQADANIITVEEFQARRLEAERKFQAELQNINDRNTQSEQALLESRAKIRTTIAEENAEARIADFQDAEKFDQLKFDSAVQAIRDQQQAEIEAVTLKNAILLENENLAKDDRIRIKEEEDEEIRKINNKSLEREEGLKDKAAKKDKIRSQDVADFVIKLNRRKFDKKIKEIDEEIDASEDQQKELRKAAQAGVKGAAEDLIVAERLEDEARLRKAEEIKKQQRREAKLVFLKLVASKADQGDKNPFLSASLDFFKTEAFLNSLDSFDKGTDRLGRPDRAVDSKGGRVIVAHTNEKILTAKHNKDMDYATNDKVVENYKLAEKFRSGDIRSAQAELTNSSIGQRDSRVLGALNELQEAVRANKPPKQETKWDPFRKAMIETIEQNGKRERRTTKIGSGGILGND